MFAENGKISNRQLQAMLLLNGFGVGALFLPGRLAAFGGQNGWQLLLGALVLGFAVFWLICKAVGQEPLPQSLEKSVGKVVAYVVLFLLLLKLLFTGGVFLNVFDVLLSDTLLTKTPAWMVGIPMILLCFYAAKTGIEGEARLAEILCVMAFLPLLVILAFACVGTDFSRMLPLEPLPASILLKGSFWTFCSLPGIELLLLVLPLLRKREQGGKSGAVALALLCFLLLFGSLLTLAGVGPNLILTQDYPLLEMLKGIKFPGAFLDRQDAFLIWFWILTALSGICSCLYFSMYLARAMGFTGKGYVGALMIYVLAVTLKNGIPLLTFCGALGFVFAIVISLLLFWRKRA